MNMANMAKDMRSMKNREMTSRISLPVLVHPVEHRVENVPRLTRRLLHDFNVPNAGLSLN